MKHVFPLLKSPRPSFRPGGQWVGIGRRRMRGSSGVTTVALVAVDEPEAPPDGDVTGALGDGFEVNEVLAAST